MMPTTRRRGDCAGVACEHTLGRQPLHLYGYLWAKPEFIADEKSGCFSFVLPDTVLFKQQKPVKWFFTSRQEKGKILTKSKKNVNVAYVLQSFMEPKRSMTSAHDRLKATPTEADDAIVATYLYPDRSPNGELVMIVEHLTPTGVQHLLRDREMPPISVLQRFVPTRSGYNHLIQSVFTPDSCLLRKCMNSNLVSDTRLCIPERTATFEADERHVKPRDVTNRELQDQIEHMHLEMSTHLTKIIGKPIARHVAYLKHGADDRIYLLWSTMLSFETGNLAFAKNMRLALSHQARLVHLVATTSSSHPKEDKIRLASSSTATKRCPACRSNLPSCLVEFLVTFKTVINAFEADSCHQPTGSCVPPLLETILPPTNDARFKELLSDKEFLYRTIELCQPCAKRINSTNKLKVRANSGLATSRPTTTKSERDKPIYMQSAHSIFWGKAERDEVANCERKTREQRSKPRPRSAVTTRTRTLVQALPSGLTRASLKRILPDISARSENVHVEEPKHCLQKLAEHLRESCGGPSMRLALARANIYPPTPEVPAELLRRVAEPGLLAQVFAYWHEFSRASGDDFAPSSIDLDALDAMLQDHGDVQSLSMRAGMYRNQLASNMSPSDQCSVTATRYSGTRVSVIHPAPPTSRRPTSCSGIRPAPSRATRLFIGAQSRPTATILPTEVDSDGLIMSPQQTHAVDSDKTPSIVSFRRIDGIKCEVHVRALMEEHGGSCALQIRAIRVDDERSRRGHEQESHRKAMELTLTTGQILELVSRRSQQTGGSMEVPHTTDALTQVVLDELVILGDCIVVRDQASPDPEPKPPVTTTSSVGADSSLTPEELRFLQECLRHD